MITIAVTEVIETDEDRVTTTGNLRLQWLELLISSRFVLFGKDNGKKKQSSIFPSAQWVKNMNLSL